MIHICIGITKIIQSIGILRIETYCCFYGFYAIRFSVPSIVNYSQPEIKPGIFRSNLNSFVLWYESPGGFFQFLIFREILQGFFKYGFCPVFDSGNPEDFAEMGGGFRSSK
ncbi:Uncharacterized protein dnm_090660 [Desulfonema magnum]|uniref:Uncharacterized protein n=1 Tax=Desulfonema magnum TaxID=45655 RepID=A0A975BX85_9BACT|nr:Uncharacterized protein dnm_090660 [Desulfonema magnum]